MRSTRLALATSLGLAAALGLAACGGGEPEAPAAVTGDGESEATGGGTFRFAINFEPENWNPMLVANTTYTQLPYEGLLGVAEDGVTVVPGLAEDYELTATEMRLSLREGVTFHDGTPFDGEAVAANIEHIQGYESEWASTLDVIEEVEVVDEHEVVLHLSAHNPSLPFNLGSRGNMMISPAALESGDWETQPVGTGPYTLNEADTQVGSLYVFDRYPDYYDLEEVGPERIEVHFIADGTSRYNALQTGQVDAARIDPAQVGEAEGAGFGTVTWEALQYQLFMFDREDIFADTRVRQAVCHAMPLEQLNAAAYESMAIFPTQRLPEEDPGYAADIEPYPYDLEAAQALMDEAGNPSISFDMPLNPGQEGVYALIQESFAEIGIEMNVLPMSGSQYFSEYLSGNYPLTFNQANSQDGGMYNYYTVRFAEDGDLNPHHVAPPAELAELFEEAMAAEDEDAQAEIFQDMSRLIHDEALDCGFINLPQTMAFDTDVVADIPVTTFHPSTPIYRDIQVLQD